MTLREVDHFSPRLGRVQIGDTLLLVDGDQIVDKASDKPRQTFFSTDADPQFLSENTLAGYANRMNEPSKLVVRRLDGTIMYQIALEAEWSGTRLITSTSGRRFCVDERGYSRWSLPHLLGYGGGAVHYNFERIRVFETTSGRELFNFKWDPRPYTSELVTPALAPNGRRVGIVRNGYLEVFNVP